MLAQVLACCSCFNLGRCAYARAMPLSVEQEIAFKNPEAWIKIQAINPKAPGSKAYQRFERHKASSSMRETTSSGTNWQDISGNFEHGWLKMTQTMNAEEGKLVASKRGVPKKKRQTRKPQRVPNCQRKSFHDHLTVGSFQICRY